MALSCILLFSFKFILSNWLRSHASNGVNHGQCANSFSLMSPKREILLHDVVSRGSLPSRPPPRPPAHLSRQSKPKYGSERRFLRCSSLRPAPRGTKTPTARNQVFPLLLFARKYWAKVVPLFRATGLPQHICSRCSPRSSQRARRAAASSSRSTRRRAPTTSICRSSTDLGEHRSVVGYFIGICANGCSLELHLRQHVQLPSGATIAAGGTYSICNSQLGDTTGCDVISRSTLSSWIQRRRLPRAVLRYDLFVHDRRPSW